jgi:hypothetical protein
MTVAVILVVMAVGMAIMVMVPVAMMPVAVK